MPRKDIKHRKEYTDAYYEANADRLKKHNRDKYWEDRHAQIERARNYRADKKKRNGIDPKTHAKIVAQKLIRKAHEMMEAKT